MRDREGDHQGVDSTWPLISLQKGAKEDKTPEDIKRHESTRAVDEGAWWRMKRGRGIEIETSSGQAGTGPQVKAGKWGEGSCLSKLHRMDGSPTGVDSGISNIDYCERGANIWGKMWQERYTARACRGWEVSGKQVDDDNTASAGTGDEARW